MAENAVVLDNLDKKLLYELNWNARASHSALAKKFRTSKQVIGYRIKKLEESESRLLKKTK